MSCFSPLLAVPTEEVGKNGKRIFKPLARFDSFKDFDPLVVFPGSMKIPCGQCRGCRMDNCRQWADRMILELDHSKKAVFLTLTYNDDHLPEILDKESGELVSTLRKRDLTNFFKRLRKQFKDVTLRYYACGEYGSNTHRPHYHIILFGLSLDDFNFIREFDSKCVLSKIELQGTNELGQKYYRCSWLAEEVWTHGFVCLSEVSWKTCAYVARYVKKKDKGLVQDAFNFHLKEPEYSVMSRRPGIGMYYPEEHPDCFEKSKFYFADQDGSVSVNLPPALLRYLYVNDRVKYNELKEERAKFSRDQELNKIWQTDLSSMELAFMKENLLGKSEEVLDFYRGL